MTTLLWTVIILAGALALLIRKIEGEPFSSTSAPLSGEFPAGAYQDFLESHGIKGVPFQPPADCLPMHASILKVLDMYEAVYAGTDVEIVNRKHVVGAYSLNNDYVQIGEWPDGSPVLVRKDDQDSNIYLDDWEECVPGVPRIFTTSLEAYVFAALDDYIAAQGFLQAWANRKPWWRRLLGRNRIGRHH